MRREELSPKKSNSLGRRKAVTSPQHTLDVPAIGDRPQQQQQQQQQQEEEEEEKKKEEEQQEQQEQQEQREQEEQEQEHEQEQEQDHHHNYNQHPKIYSLHTILLFTICGVPPPRSKTL